MFFVCKLIYAIVTYIDYSLSVNHIAMCTCCRLCKLNDIKFSCCLNGMDSTSYQVGIIKITTNDVVYITKTSNNVKAPVTYNCFSQSDVFVRCHYFTINSSKTREIEKGSSLCFNSIIVFLAKLYFNE